MSIPSKSPHSSRRNSFSNLFGLTKQPETETGNEIVNYTDNHEGSQPYELVQDNGHPSDHQHDRHDGENSVDDYDEAAKSATFTQNHPLGRILLGLQNNLKKKGIQSEDICYDFYEAMQIDARNKERQLMQMTKLVEDNLIKKELTSHTITMDIRPPMCYAHRPTMVTVAQRNECIRLFPSRVKFGGSSKDNNMDVVEFLYAMNAAHESFKISKEEFKQMLLLCTTGKPHSLIRGWISSGYDITTIYHYLQVHFDTRLSPQEASEQLRNYKAPKTANLAQVQAHLMELASRVVTQIPEGPSRNAIFDVEMTQALIRCLPHESQQMVHTKYNELSARQGRSTTAAELSQSLHSIRHIVDQDIRRNGVERSGKPSSVETRVHRQIPGVRRFVKRPSVHLVQTPLIDDDCYDDDDDESHVGSLQETECWQDLTDEIECDCEHVPKIGRHCTGDGNLGTKVFHVGHSVANSRDMRPNKDKIGGNMVKNNSNGFSVRSKSNSVNKVNNYRKGNESNMQFRKGNYCSLCGKQTHTAVDCCFNMVDDNGKRVRVLPTHSTCTECPQHVVPRLNHPIPLCPYRKTGPFSHLA